MKNKTALGIILAIFMVPLLFFTASNLIPSKTTRIVYDARKPTGDLSSVSSMRSTKGDDPSEEGACFTRADRLRMEIENAKCQTAKTPEETIEFCPARIKLEVCLKKGGQVAQ